jgi:hypothetical protein
MDVGAVSNGRAAFETVRSRRPETEPEPAAIIVARMGLAPLPEFTGGEPLQEDLLRSGLRQRSLLADLDAVLSEPEADARRGEAERGPRSGE